VLPLSIRRISLIVPGGQCWVLLCSVFYVVCVRESEGSDAQGVKHSTPLHRPHRWRGGLMDGLCLLVALLPPPRFTQWHRGEMRVNAGRQVSTVCYHGDMPKTARQESFAAFVAAPEEGAGGARPIKKCSNSMPKTQDQQPNPSIPALKILPR
jgi:hypothetical protein